jgi:hypothetical protein
MPADAVTLVNSIEAGGGICADIPATKSRFCSSHIKNTDGKRTRFGCALDTVRRIVSLERLSKKADGL